MQVGARLGPYEIVSLIGAGGMGEVWRARDTRLDRDVAVKILPAEFAADAKLKVRFEREAKTISHLSHPNICTLFDVGESYIVMELLEGESLADRLTRGPIPLNEVVRYGVQIADALAKAHREGVIHRDLKPGNVMLTKSGAKLLDFGLAKSTVAASPAEGATVQKPLTNEGTILGTFQYMAPEQLVGEEPDARTDIFALGAVLYEMTTGKAAFDGKNRTSLVAMIISGEPRPLRELQPLTPPALDHVVTKCLEKEREDRWQSAADVAEELRWMGQAGSGSGVAAPITRRRKAREWTAWCVAAIALAVAVYASWRNWTVPSHPVLRAAALLPPGVIVSETGQPVTISPDGKLIVFGAWEADNKARLWMRRADRVDAQPMSGTEGAINPFFSPDGKWVGFAAGGLLKKIATGGGAAITICPVRDFRGATWSADGVIYFVPSSNDVLWKVPDSGGRPVQVSRLDPSRDENSLRWPQVMPDGRHVLVTTKTGQITSFNDGRIAVVSVSDGSMRTVVEGGMYGRYIPTGHLVYARASGLYSVRFDLKRMRTSGAPVLILDGVMANDAAGLAKWDVSANGTLVYLPHSSTTELGLLWFDRQGRMTRQSTAARYVLDPRISPDGRTIALTLYRANDDIGLFDIGSGMLTRLSFESGNESYPLWSPDGLRVFYTSELRRGYRVMSRRADGTGTPEEVFRSDNRLIPSSISPDGKLLGCQEWNGATNRVVFFFSLPDRRRISSSQLPFDEAQSVFSPDGRFLASVSNETGQFEVYVRSLRSEGRWKVSASRAWMPRWSHDGRELFFFSSAGLEAAPVGEGGSVTLGKPQLIIPLAQFPTDIDYTGGFDVAPDGRFVIGYANRASISQLNLVTNWFDDVRHRTASGQ